MKVHLFIQARVSSKRLPEKILKKIKGKSLIEIILERAKKIKGIDKIIVVTGPREKNFKLIQELEKLDIEYFSGNEENVLDRFYNAGLYFNSECIIRITGDNPLIDSDIISEGLEIFKKNKFDILSINRIPSFPYGMNFEIFTQNSLIKSWEKNFELFPIKENFYNTFINPVKYILENNDFINYDMLCSEKLDHIRLTVDYKEDFLLVEKIFENLYEDQKYFGLKEILEFLKENPILLEINSKHRLNQN